MQINIDKETTEAILKGAIYIQGFIVSGVELTGSYSGVEAIIDLELESLRQVKLEKSERGPAQLFNPNPHPLSKEANPVPHTPDDKTDDDDFPI